MRNYRNSKQNVLYGHEEFIKNHNREEIMEKFNVDYNTVNNFCHKNGIRPIPARIHKLECPDGFAEYAKAHTICQTAKFFNIKYQTVMRMCKEKEINCIKVSPKRIPFDSSENHSLKRSGLAHDMIRELGKTFTFASISRVFGYSKERIRKICES